MLKICDPSDAPSATTTLQVSGSIICAIAKKTQVSAAIRTDAITRWIRISPARFKRPSCVAAEIPTAFIAATSGIDSIELPCPKKYVTWPRALTSWYSFASLGSAVSPVIHGTGTL